MYSFTVTGINNILPVEAHEPQLRIRCSCQRNLIQEEIFTCMSCFKYCCHYCTIPEIMFFQCRNCKTQYETAVKANKCKLCFSCPYCSNVLSATKTQNKKSILWCQHCYWTTKQINIVAEKSEDLLETLNKLTSNLKGTQQKIYNLSQGLFKEVTKNTQDEDQMMKVITGVIKQIKKIPEKSLKDIVSQGEKNSEQLIKRVGLNDQSQEFDYQEQYPENLPLLAKKIRKCPFCKKPLTTLYRTNKPIDQKSDLVHKQIKMLQCQVKPALNGKVKIKCLKDLKLQQEDGQQHIECKAQEIKQVEVNKLFKVIVQLFNKAKTIMKEAEYQFIVLVE